MFKRSIITDEASQDFERAANLAQEMGLTGVEIRSVWDKGPHMLDADDAGRILDICEAKGLQVCAISAPFFKCRIGSQEEYDQHIEILRKCIHLGRRLGTNIIRGFAFWQEEGGADAYWDQIIAKFKVAVDVVESEGAILAIENEPSCFCNNAKVVKRMVEAIGSKSVLPLWDPGNDIFDHENEVPFPDGYNYVKDQMIHMHIKDMRRDENGKPGPAKVGHGDVDMVGQFVALLNDGYSGWISLETHYRVQGQLSEQLLTLPSGSSFSEGGEIASIECIQEWDRIIAEAKAAIG